MEGVVKQEQTLFNDLHYKKNKAVILGHSGERQEGGRKWAARARGFGFILQGGGSTFCSRRGEGYCKNYKKSPNNALYEGDLEICSKYV